MSSKKMKQPKLTLLIVVCFWFAQYVYIPQQTPYLTTLNVSSSLIGVIIGSYGISQMMMRLPVGIAADIRSNHKLFIILGTLCAGGASLLRILFSNGTGFLIANIFSGFASATWISFMILYTGFFPKAQQARETSKVIMANNLGILLGFTASTLFYDFIGMIGVCLLSAVAGGIGFILALRLEKPASSQSELKPLQLLSVAGNKKLLFFAALAMIQQGIQMSSTMSFTNQIIKDLGASSFILGLSSILYMLAAVLFSRVGTTNFMDKFTKTQWVFGSFSLLTIYCLLVPNTASVAFICLLQIIPGLATGILFSMLTSEAISEVPNEKRSTGLGLFQAIYAIGMTVFPVVAGSLNNAYSMSAAYLFLAGLAALGAVSILVYHSITLKNRQESEYV